MALKGGLYAPQSASDIQEEIIVRVLSHAVDRNVYAVSLSGLELRTRQLALKAMLKRNVLVNAELTFERDGCVARCGVCGGQSFYSLRERDDVIFCVECAERYIHGEQDPEYVRLRPSTGTPIFGDDNGW